MSRAEATRLGRASFALFSKGCALLFVLILLVSQTGPIFTMPASPTASNDQLLRPPQKIYTYQAL